MKKAIVTGASGNLGKAVVLELLGEGYEVAGTGLFPEPLNGYTGAKVDLSDDRATHEWVATHISTGNVETAVLTVGGFAMGDISATLVSDIHEQIRLNFDTAYRVAAPLFTHMKEKGSGTIFLVGSQAGMSVEKNLGVTAYGLAKSLLFRLADLMNLEAKGTAVKVFVVVPFIIDTPANRASMPDADRTTWQTPELIASRIAAYMEHPADNDTLMVF
jgi:NAD(P)-dependent dehydrogenase (short-subunit alcohol dehydrogenase family)